MSNHTGYKGKSLSFLQDYNLQIGDMVIMTLDVDYFGMIMPRYENSDPEHIVLKLKSGYNVGLEVDKIKKVQIQSKLELKKEIIQQPQTNPNLPKLLLISTGGTIASKVDYRTGGVTPALTAAELYSSVPELSEIANIETEVLFSEYSENLLPEHWKKIAEKINSFVKSEYKGIIVAHGTDTMQYTAAALSFSLVNIPIPIALVGSQRSSDRPSSDAALNLISAVKFLVGCDTTGIYVVMHNTTSDDEIACHWGTRVRKNHTSKRDAFQTIGGFPAFTLKDDKIIKNKQFNYMRKQEYVPRINFDTRVALVKYYPGQDSNIINHILEDGYKAIIFEGTGLGHIGKIMYDNVAKAKKMGLFMGMTSQCIDGTVCMTVYESGRDLLNLGIIPLENMIPETALVKAMWALGNSKNSQEMEVLMKENIALEFSD